MDFDIFVGIRQVGECEVVLEAGARALEKWEARSLRRDILFACALAHLGLASDALEAREQVRHGDVCLCHP